MTAMVGLGSRRRQGEGEGDSDDDEDGQGFHHHPETAVIPLATEDPDAPVDRRDRMRVINHHGDDDDDVEMVEDRDQTTLIAKKSRSRDHQELSAAAEVTRFPPPLEQEDSGFGLLGTGERPHRPEYAELGQPGGKETWSRWVRRWLAPQEFRPEDGAFGWLVVMASFLVNFVILGECRCRCRCLGFVGTTHL